MSRNVMWWSGVCAILTGAHNLSAVSADTQPTLDELLQLEPPAQPVAPAPDQPLDEVVSKGLQGIKTPDGLEMVLREMQEAEDNLGEQLNAGIETQRLQESALSRLDTLIAEAKKQCSVCQGGSSGSEARPENTGSRANAKPATKGSATDSENNDGNFSPGAVGPVGPDGRPLSQTRSEWGNLPPRLRDELVQSMRERFSLIYQSLTEAYYRRLAEED